MGCNYRVALANTKLGLPEVKLGIIPGAGGTQRLPRLAGIEKALAMITSGTPVSAKDAFDYGILEKVFEDALIENSISFIKNKLSQDNHPITSKLTEKISGIKDEVFDTFSNAIKKKYRGRKSPLCAVEAIKGIY